jgi:ABC-2 type transport system permease protein
MLYFPARLLSGESVDLAAGFGAMAAWLALLVPINLLLWRAGVRRYAALGA